MNAKFAKLFHKTNIINSNVPQNANSALNSNSTFVPFSDNWGGGDCLYSLCRICLLLLVLFLIPNSLKAEQSGWFVGVQGGYAKATAERIIDTGNSTITNTYHTCNMPIIPLCKNEPINQEFFYESSSSEPKLGFSNTFSQDFKGYNAGLLAGYKHFFSSKFGLRLYTLFDTSFFKNDESALQSKFQAYNYTLNLDLLYNLIAKDDFSFGVFGGVGAGGVRYVSSGNNFDDINLSLNLGLRMNLSHHHGFEFFSRFGNNGLFQKEKHESGEATTTNAISTILPNILQRRVETITMPTNRYTDTFSQPYQIGIRLKCNFHSFKSLCKSSSKIIVA